MIWYGISEAVSKYPDKAVKLALSSKLPTVTRLITRRLAEDLEKTPGPVNELLSSTTDENRLPILRGLNEALKGWSKATETGRLGRHRQSGRRSRKPKRSSANSPSSLATVAPVTSCSPSPRMPRPIPEPAAPH